jgi:hypothetical protein
MILDELHIQPTDKTPEIFLDPEGTIKIKGRGLIVNRTELPDIVLNWIDIYLLNPAEVTYIIIAFEYLNSFSTSMLVTIIKRVSEVAFQSKKLIIKWFYEEDDEDILERGEYIASSVQIPFEFIVSHKIADL